MVMIVIQLFCLLTSWHYNPMTICNVITGKFYIYVNKWQNKAIFLILVIINQTFIKNLGKEFVHMYIERN
jgi:hypothetical protein